MAKLQITLEDDNEHGVVTISLNGAGVDTKAGRLAMAMMNQARLVSRIPAPDGLFHSAVCHIGCGCDTCQAVRELAETKPTIH